MKIILISLIFTHFTFTSSGNAGTSLFRNKSPNAACWSEGEILKLRARKLFENLIPRQVQLDELNESYIVELVRYFRAMLRTANVEKNPHMANILKEAIADTIGAHLRKDILPTVRFAYYAGYIPYTEVKLVHDFYENIKNLLNTQGNGWVQPAHKPQWNNVTVAKILISPGALFDPCSSLIVKRDSNLCLSLPIPKLNDRTKPSAIALPFKSGGLVSLTAPSSNDILLKYYTTAARCILTASPRPCRHADFLSFNTGLWNWMRNDVARHLLDENLYAAFGGILRIAAAVQTYGKDLRQRSLYGYNGFDISYIISDIDTQEKPTSWYGKIYDKIVNSQIDVFMDLSPELCLYTMVAIALAIYIIHLIYSSYAQNGCACDFRRSYISSCFHSLTSEVSERPTHFSPAYFSEKMNELSPLKMKHVNKSRNLNSHRVEKVQTSVEKMEQGVMSSNESESSSSESETFTRTVQSDQTRLARSRTVQSVSVRAQRIARRLARSATVASESETCSTESDYSSRSSYSPTSSTDKTKDTSRDLAWAQRFISIHSVRSKSSLTTKSDMDAFTTPPSFKS